MPIEHVIFEPRDRFVTLDRDNHIRVWEATDDGGLLLIRTDDDQHQQGTE